MKVLKNKKGFTLVELLAVIVVLAIIILVAMPAVMSAMDKARRNSLINEANEIVKIAQSAYSEETMDATAGVVGGEAYCYSIGWLKEKGYLEKNLSNYSGGILLNVVNGVATYNIFLDNGMYYIDGTEFSSLKNGDLKAGDGTDDNMNACKTNAGNDIEGFRHATTGNTGTHITVRSAS